jgi:hypothetical protein
MSRQSIEFEPIYQPIEVGVFIGGAYEPYAVSVASGGRDWALPGGLAVDFDA